MFPQLGEHSSNFFPETFRDRLSTLLFLWLYLYIAVNLERCFPWVTIWLKVIFSQHIKDIIQVFLTFIVDVEKPAVGPILISLLELCFLWLPLRSTLCRCSAVSRQWSKWRLLLVYPAWDYWDLCICRPVSFISPGSSHPLIL